MHIYFSGIGGTGIGPLALIAHQAGYEVSGSDKQQSQYTDYLQKHGIRLHIGQTDALIAEEHAIYPIDWLVYSSALPLEQPDHPELLFAQRHGIKTTKRDEFLNELLSQKSLQMLAVAGTHGKTTSTAMVIWLCKELGIPLSYSVGAKINFGDMGTYTPGSRYFAYECDEFDRNFLQFKPAISIITTVDWDHHEIYPTRDDYKAAFRQFIGQSNQTIIYQKDADYLQLAADDVTIIGDTDELIDKIPLPGAHNRRNARLVLAAVSRLTDKPMENLLQIVGRFPGSSRRFEQIIPGLYSDYAHTPEEVTATIQMARELNQHVVVVYEPLTDRRQHYMKDQYYSTFEQADHVYWLPSYLAREASDQPILTPDELIKRLRSPKIAEPAEKGDALQQAIVSHIRDGALVLCLAGGGGGSLDEWVRQMFTMPV